MTFGSVFEDDGWVGGSFDFFPYNVPNEVCMTWNFFRVYACLGPVGAAENPVIAGQITCPSTGWNAKVRFSERQVSNV